VNSMPLKICKIACSSCSKICKEKALAFRPKVTVFLKRCIIILTTRGIFIKRSLSVNRPYPS